MKQIQKFLSVPGRIVLSLMLFLLAGCGLGDIAVTSASLTPQPTCLPAGGGFYNFAPSAQGQIAKKIADDIFAGYPGKPLEARREALRFLTYETMRWSHFRDEGDGNTHVRILVTFITPELIRAVILNQVLSSPTPQAQGLDNYMQGGFNHLSKRNEFVFLLTFQPDTTDANKTFSIRPADIQLHNTSNLRALSSHSDDFLNEAHRFSDGTQSGYIFYPIGVVEKAPDCSRVLDPEWDTSLMLTLQNAQIGDQDKKAINWTIPFTSLLLTDGTMFHIDLDSPVQPGDESFFTSLHSPPTPFFGNDPDQYFWRDYGRFIWSKLTSDIVVTP